MPRRNNKKVPDSTKVPTQTLVEVIQPPPPEKPIERPVLATAIMEISKAFRTLNQSGLNKKAIVVLVAHLAGQSQSTVRSVLDALSNLEREYTN